MKTVISEAALRPCSYLHLGSERVYNPLTDRTLTMDDAGCRELVGLISGALDLEQVPQEVQDALRRQGWLVDAAVDELDESRRFHLKYVSLEAHTLCNQACYFCPVAVAPRDAHFMPTAMYEDIVRQLREFRHTLEGVFMINYNEPTADRRFVDQVGTLIAAELPPAVLTNGTGLTPDRVDAIVDMGGLRYLSVNLSTLDRAKYQADREGDHLDLVLRHLDHARDLPLAQEMEIVVLGTGDSRHQEDTELIRSRFAGSRFKIKSFEVMDRAGYLDVGLKARHQKLRGCENIGSRPLQHLHITPHGKCVLCCEDYDEKYVVGDLNQETVKQVLGGAALARLRRWAYGIEESPEDFLCRHCIYAREAPAP